MTKKQNYKLRQRLGLTVLKVQIPHYEVVESLIESGRISVADALDRSRVEREVAELVVEWSRRWQGCD